MTRSLRDATARATGSLSTVEPDSMVTDGWPPKVRWAPAPIAAPSARPAT